MMNLSFRLVRKTREMKLTRVVKCANIETLDVIIADTFMRKCPHFFIVGENFANETLKTFFCAVINAEQYFDLIYLQDNLILDFILFFGGQNSL